VKSTRFTVRLNFEKGTKTYSVGMWGREFQQVSLN